MFKPKYLKQAKLLRKGVKKFLHYKEDLISTENMETIEQRMVDFEAAVATRDKEAIKADAKKLTTACEKAIKPSSTPGLRENLEVIFVAIVIAIGIRSYFVQPFRIPTGSMQPTLNGVIAKLHDPADGAFKEPGFLKKFGQKVSEGRNYVDFTIPAGAEIDEIKEVTMFKFFTWTKIFFKDPSMEPESIYVSKKTLLDPVEGGGFGLRSKLGLQFENAELRRVKAHRPLNEDVTLQGYFDTGDQVLVDKVSYHFRQPNRGEVFVFSTRDIYGVQSPLPPGHSQHYIKRLVAIPNDLMELKEHRGPLWINGKPAEEEGIKRVSEDESYGGYTLYDERHQSNGPPLYVQLEDRQYMALGDNSANSADSRSWGPVPEVNLVGPALMVYWPFEHWGKIR